MEIIVNHLTRMKAPRVCVAGMETGASRHIRAVTDRSNPLTRDLLAENGGPFALGAVVELGEVRPQPSPPEVEDHAFRPRNAVVVEMLSPDGYFEALYERAHRDIESVFGSELMRTDWTYATEEGRGSASLGVLLTSRKPGLEVNDYGKLRLRFNDPDKPAYLPVTDLRFYEADQDTIRTAAVADVNARMSRGVDTLLMLGLARLFQGRHWVQVNGICLADRPLDNY